jgi:hypothetical protein
MSTLSSTRMVSGLPAGPLNRKMNPSWLPLGPWRVPRTRVTLPEAVTSTRERCAWKAA